MSAYGTELGQVVYDAETGSYGARVTFHEDSDAESFECCLTFPVDASMPVVAAALVRQAKELRRRTRVPVTSRLDPDTVRIVALGPHQRRRAVRRKVLSSA